MSPIRVSRSVLIPDDELSVRFSTSGGPGGQHANKAATRVEIIWNVDGSRAITERQRERIKHRLRNRIDASGALRVVADGRRSQLRNRAEAETRLASLVHDSLRVRRARVATGPSKAAVERRLKEKRHRSEKKRARRDRGEFD
jgi:ribosome-associated protein